MAGRRHHIIPRFLQKGFSSKTRKKQHYTFVFTKEKQPYETNLTNVGLELDFYGDPDQPEADDNITEAEVRYGKFIDELRITTTNKELNSNDCAEFTAHMQIRAKKVRDTFTEVGSSIMASARNELATFDDNEKLIKHLIKKQRKVVAKEIKAVIPDNYSDDEKFLITKRLLDNPDTWVSEIAQRDNKELVLLLTLLLKKLPGLVKYSQNKALEKTTEAKGIKEISEKLKWKLFNLENNNLILGDIGVFGQFAPDNEFRSLMFVKEYLDSVYIPISSNQLIVGYKNDNLFSLPSIDDINLASASLSKNWFITSQVDESFIRLSSFIGLKYPVIGLKEEKIIEDKISTIIPK